MLKFLKKYWPLALLAAAFMIGEVLVDLVQPRLMATIVDDGILGLSSGGVSNIHLIISTGIRMLLVVVAGGACGILSGVFTNLCAQNFGNDVRKACFARIMHFSFDQTDKFSTGSLITRTTSDVTQVQSLVSQMIRGFVRCLMFFFGGGLALVSLDLSFGVIVAVAIPLLLLAIVFTLWKANPLFTLVQKKLDRMNTVIQENISGARVVKAFIQEEREEKRFGEANTDLVNTQFRVLILMSYLRPFMNIVLNLAVVGILYIGGRRVSAGAIAPGHVMAAITYISQILSGLMMLAMIFQTLSRGLASSRRLKEVLNTAPSLADGPRETRGRKAAAEGLSPEGEAPQDAGCQTENGQGSGTGAAAQRGSVRFRNVQFVYPGAGSKALVDIDLSVAPGETLGIIGATASGKSTLVNLIPRFRDVLAGAVEVDGVNVKDYPLAELREKVAFVLQKSELFSTTIGENIAIGRPGASPEEIRKAARAAQADDFIQQQAQGYDTPVAEAGMSLSGGQRQRIAVSRALLKKAEILIFDDATSALDLATEAALYAALRAEYADVTKIIIAQRVASIRGADRIAVIDEGRIAGLGTHEELLAGCAIYRDICASQGLSDLSGAEAAGEDDAPGTSGEEKTECCRTDTETTKESAASGGTEPKEEEDRRPDTETAEDGASGNTVSEEAGHREGARS